MLYLLILLHIYQPPTQDPKITKKISQDSYRLILKILAETKGKITLNIPASLSEQLITTGEEDVIRGIIDLVKRKQIELTATSAYHALLPLLPESEILRQITLNNYLNKKILGEKIYCPDGLFPPELAYSNRLTRVLKQLKFQRLILSEFAYKRELGKVKHDVIYIKDNTKNVILGTRQLAGTPESDSGPASPAGRQARMTKIPLQIFFRDDRLSNAVALSQVKTLSKFNNLIKSLYGEESKRDRYLIIAIDGETFGHHQVGQDKLLLDILRYYKLQLITFSECGKYFHTKEEISPLICSWGSTLTDLRKKIYWPKWSYPGNPIHKLQWQLTRLALKLGKNSHGESRELLDKGLHSDQYWWASHKPYWHPQMVEKGAKLLLESIKLNTKASTTEKNDALSIYCDILKIIN
ncbi:hypothetical protein HY030_02990 [Candidatus Gottesmanbacteria bacterium]|nr:hypothetical protein [Candidatus Gottesmanbacteria bacterium]